MAVDQLSFDEAAKQRIAEYRRQSNEATDDESRMFFDLMARMSPAYVEALKFWLARVTPYDSAMAVARMGVAFATQIALTHRCCGSKFSDEDWADLMRYMMLKCMRTSRVAVISDLPQKLDG